MSHHGLQVLYSLMNQRADWACERCFTPWTDFEQVLRERFLASHADAARICQGHLEAKLRIRFVSDGGRSSE